MQRGIHDVIGPRGELVRHPLGSAVLQAKRREADPAALPALLRYVVFDSAVNSGPNQAIRWLQHALDVQVDGVLGPVTLKAALECNTLRVTGFIMAQRLVFMTNLPSWGSFSRGWARRIAKMLEEA